MKKDDMTKYTIVGKVDPKEISDILEDGRVMAYAVRDRRVVGRAAVEPDGSFRIKYQYDPVRRAPAPYGVDLIIGPVLPGDEILRAGFERTFLSSEGFERSNPSFEYVLAESVKLPIEWRLRYERIYPLTRCEFTYTGFVYTCSPLNDPPGGQAGCSSPMALSSVDTEAYVRIMSKAGPVIAEGVEIDLTGRFEYTHTWTVGVGFFCAYVIEPVDVEVYQETGEGDHIIYSGEHTFFNNVAEDIFIDRDQVEIIARPPEPTAGPSNYFGFERIGNVPVEAVYYDGEVTGEFGANVAVPTEFVGYANSVDKPGVTTGSADLKVKDYAFGGKLHFYANLGESFGQSLPGGVDMSDVTVKYFRLKYSYFNPETLETIADTYISIPFNNTRSVVGGTTTEFMGAHHTHPTLGTSLPHPTYQYPNPYETDANRNWKYRGLLLVLNTNTLPHKSGRYTFCVEPLDANMNPVTILDPNDCVLELMIDNDKKALTGEIGDIIKGGVSVPVCGFLDLTAVGHCTASDLDVQYSVDDAHGHLRSFSMTVQYGESDAEPISLSGHTYTRSGSTPQWKGVQGDVATKTFLWRTCGHQFRLVATRRVTNGFHTIHWKPFTFHVTILSSTSYSDPCP
jgi:hypothetical protein